MYIDLFFVLNAWMDFLVLSITGQISGRRGGLFRRLCGAAGGALCACLFLILPTDSMPLRLAFGALTAFLMAWIAFSPLQRGEGLKLTAELFVTAMLFNGALNLFCTGTGKGTGVIAFLLLAGACCLSMKAGFFYWKRHRERRKYRMQALLYHHGEKVVLPALWDTGNHLYTCEGHRPVHMVEREAVLPLLGEQPFYHVVPYQAVGTEQGAVLAVTIDRILLKQGETMVTLEKPVIGLYEKSLSAGGAYRMLLHADTPLQEGAAS